jgi:hypothetical protein
MWARHQDKLGSDLKTWAAAGAIPSMNYENTISFLTLVATICGLAFEYFGLKHRKAAPTPVTTKRRRKKRRRTARR